MIVPSLYRLPYIAYSYGCLLRRLRYIDNFSEVHLFLKGERNQLMIWGFTEFRTNKKMKI